MADLIIVEPFPLTLAPAYALPLAAPHPSIWMEFAAGRQNLITDDPREVAVATLGAGNNMDIYIDLGSDMSFDTVALINTNANAGAGWRVFHGTTAQAGWFASSFTGGSVSMRAASEDEPASRGPAFAWAAAPVTARYVALQVGQGVGGDFLQIGRVVIGKSWKPSLGMEIGAGRPPIDSGSRERLADGGLATVSGSLVSGFEWTFGDLATADLKKLWGIMRRRRTTEPLLLVEDPAAPLAEGIHYGTFVNLQRFERKFPSKSRWQLQMEDWI